MTNTTETTPTLDNNTMYGNVSESDIINAIDNALSKYTDDDNVSLADYYNAIFKLHMDVFPQNTPAKLILDNMAMTRALIKSSPDSKLHHLATHVLYEAIILMGTFKILKESDIDLDPIKKAIKSAWLNFYNKLQNS